MNSFKDQLSRELHFKERPERIVSLVPSITELIVDLGLEVNLLGVTKFCVHPKHIKKTKTIVGGTKQAKIDRIAALNPDIILCNKEENTLEMVETLEKIAPVYVSDIETLADIKALITDYAKIFGCHDEARVLLSKLLHEEEQYSLWLKGQNPKKAAYFIWKKPYMVVGSNTFIHNMMEVAGFSNVFADTKRYPEIYLNHPRLKDADYIFLSSEPYPFKPKDIEVFELTFPNKTIGIVDGELFSWYGSRLLQSFKYFKTLHHFK